MNKIRCFIGIELTDEIKEYLQEFQKLFSPTVRGIKIIPKENLHITLKFLGDVPLSTLPQITSIIKQTSSQFKPLTFYPTSSGVFPNTQFPKVLWVGICDTDDRISLLAKMLEEKLTAVGIKKDNREFSPHITIGYIKSVNPHEKLIELLNKPAKITERRHQTVKEIILFKSTLTPNGALYEKLDTTILQ